MAVRLAKLLGGEGFEDATEEELEANIDQNAAPMNDNNMLEMTKEITQEDKDSKNEEEPEKVSGLTIECLAESMQMTKNIQSSIDD